MVLLNVAMEQKKSNIKYYSNKMSFLFRPSDFLWVINSNKDQFVIRCVSSGFLHNPSVLNNSCVQLFVLFIPPPTARQKTKYHFDGVKRDRPMKVSKEGENEGRESVECRRGVLKREMVIDGRGKMWWNSETETEKKKQPWRERGADEEMWGVEVKLNPGWRAMEW